MDSAEGSVWVQNSLESSLVAKVKKKKDRYSSLVKLKKFVRDQKEEAFPQGRDGVLRCQGRLCVLDVDCLRKKSISGVKCNGDQAVVVPLESTGVQDSLSYKEILVEILDRQGYVAREFTKQGIKPGELAIISKETEMLDSQGFMCALDRSGGEKQLPEWYAEKCNNFSYISLILSTYIVKADLASKTLVSAVGNLLNIKNLLLQLDLLEINVADKIVEALKVNKNAKAVVVREGYIGLELTIVLRLNNIEVDMVYPELWCMPQLFTEGIAALYEGYYRKKGVNMIKVEAVKLKEDGVFKDDIVVVGGRAIPLTSLFEEQVETEKK
ncbi:Monodehydroascorbate reductase [Capsicum baccatum]|uniref:Monodehydroascorbate reductase n=1 Tax=Capsicum baccatum TaxID=33114 RepID=A0A2G2VM73_CAPBA|nr:Monodehydroascorbate reductase [Capsicum baccatum]